MAGYRALADVLRERITSGQLAPGARFPSERDLQQEFGLSRDTVRDAIGVLRGEGAIVVRHGHTSTVADFGPKEDVIVEAGSTVEARTPTPAERERLGMPQGWPVLHVVRPDGSGDLYPAHLFRVRVAEDGHAGDGLG